MPEPTENHAEIIREIIKTVSVNANDIPDIHLAALAMEHGLKVYFTDSDFLKYSGITWVNPLE